MSLVPQAAVRLPLQTVAQITLASGAAAGAAILLTDREFRVEVNDTVNAALERYREQAFFGEALSRGARYLPRINEIFTEEGVPVELAYLALVESEFQPQAESWAKARGVWQFMPVTGRRFGLAQTSWVDERSDPEKATRAAAKYLRILHDTFGDWNLALAAYNAGEGTVQRAIDKYGTRDFWELASTGGLARETQNYVPRIHAAILLARSPQDYGITVQPAPPLASEVVSVEDTVDLLTVARCAGTEVDALLELNPALKRLATPAQEAFELRVPEGTGTQVDQCLAAIPENRRARLHLVRRGQTLKTVARLYGASPSEIADANQISARQRLRRGTQLIIPAAD